MDNWERKRNDKQRRVLNQAGIEATHHVLADVDHVLDKKDFYAKCKQIKKKMK